MTSGSKQHSGSGKTSKASSSDSKKLESKKKDEAKEVPPPPPPTKVVVRRLPPTMTREQFVECVSPMPDHDYLHFSGTEKSLGPANGCSQATINFLEAEDVWDFKEKFDGYVFDVGDGREHSAIVEFAPNQKAPKHGERSLKGDPKMGTVEDDRDFVKFMDALENPEEVETGKAKTIEQYMDEVEARERELRNNKTYTTPLLDFVREQRQEKRAKRDLKREARKKREKERRELRDEERKKRKEKKEAGEIKAKSANLSKHSDNDAKVKESPSPDKPPKRERGRNRRESRKDEPPREDKREGKPTKVSEDDQKKVIARREGKWDKRNETRQSSAQPPTNDSGKHSKSTSSASARDEGKDTAKESKAREPRKKDTGGDVKKDKVKNKERPAMEIYRPGQGRLSSQSKSEGNGSEAKGARPDSSNKSDKKAPRTTRKDDLPFEKRPSTAESDSGKNRSGHGRQANSGRRQQEQLGNGRGKPQDATSGPLHSNKTEEKRQPVKERSQQSQPSAKTSAVKKEIGQDGGTASAVSSSSTPASDGGKSGKSYRDKRRERQLMRQNKDGAGASANT